MPGVFLGVWDTISEQKKDYHSKLKKKISFLGEEGTWGKGLVGHAVSNCYNR